MSARTKWNGAFSMILMGLLAMMIGCATAPERSNAAATQTQATTNAFTEAFDAAWRVIRETHFDPQLNGVDWTGVRDELRPKAQAATSERELRAVIQEMLDRLGQSHMTLMPRETANVLDPQASTKSKRPTASAPSSSNRPAMKLSKAANQPADHPDASADATGDLGFEVRLIENQIVVSRVEPNGSADRAGVKAGWIVEAIDGEAVTAMLDLLPDKLDERRKKVMAWTTVMASLKGNPGSAVQIRFRDGIDHPRGLELARVQTPGVPAQMGFLPTFFARLQSERTKSATGANIGVIRFNFWMIPIAPEFDQAIDALRDCDGIVLDLRGNVGGVAGMIMGFSGHFLKDRVSLGTMKARDLELQFIANPRLVNAAGRRVEPYARPVAILTDDLSLSASEIFAGGMQAIGRARIFGQPTMGAALPSIYERLPNGDVLMHAVGDFVTASGVRLEGRGVKPDEVIPMTRRDLLAGRDAALEAAINWIDKEREKRTIRSSVGPTIGAPKTVRAGAL